MTQVRFWYVEEDDKIFREMHRLKQYEVQQKGLSGYKNPYYTTEQIKQFTENLKQGREPREGDIINKIEEIFGTSFKQKYMIYYCVGYCSRVAGRSHPLTICVGATKDTDVIGLTLIHELLHIKQWEGKEYNHLKNYMKYIGKKYGITDHSVVSHIILYAVMYYVCDETGLSNIYNIIKKPIKGSHKTTWEYIEEHGHKNIRKTYNEIKNGSIVI